MAKIGIDPEVAKTRSRVAVASRRGDTLSLADARRDLAAAKIADYIERVVGEAPDLSGQQRDRLALLLRGSDAA